MPPKTWARYNTCGASALALLLFSISALGQGAAGAKSGQSAITPDPQQST